VWELCGGKITTAAIVDQLVKERGQEIDRAVMREYVLRCFEMLDQQRLVIFSRI
jgi:hypothetical protein